MAGETTTAVGVLRAEMLFVERQLPPVPGRLAARPSVPCPEPPGGWAEGGAPFDDRSPDDAALNAYHARHPEMIGRVRLLRPTPDRQVAAVLAKDEAERGQALAELGPSFAGRLCVVVSTEDVTLARTAQNDERFQRGMMSSGVRLTDQLRQVAHFQVWRVTESMVSALADYPPGMVELAPFLEVVPNG